MAQPRQARCLSTPLFNYLLPAARQGCIRASFWQVSFGSTGDPDHGGMPEIAFRPRSYRVEGPAGRQHEFVLAGERVDTRGIEPHQQARRGETSSCVATIATSPPPRR